MDLTESLAVRFAGQPRRVTVLAPPLRSIFELALENAVEGVVRETFGAAVALWRAENATDPDVRAALREIAEDECGHAELALRIASFLDERLSADERDALARARHAAAWELATSLDEPPAAIVEIAGVPSRTHARALLDGVREHVWSEVSSA